MAKGFFTAKQVAVVRGDEAPPRRASVEKATCATCSLKKQCVTPKMPVKGQGARKVLIIQGFPSENEDARGRPYAGESGRRFLELMESIGIDILRDCWSTFATICRPAKGKAPSGVEIEACRERLHRLIDELDPLVIIPMGSLAMRGLVGDRLSGRLAGLSEVDWAGECIPDQHLGRWILPTWETWYLADRKPDPFIQLELKKHFRKAFSLTETPCKKVDYAAHSFPVFDVDGAIDIIRQFRKNEGAPVAFDYETTGKKPHREGHRIFTASLSNGIDAWAFPFFDDIDFLREWKKLMVSTLSPKIAHNAKFEWLWTRVCCGYWPQRLLWDSQVGARALRNQKKANLKFRAYAHFGVAGYDDTIDWYLESPEIEENTYGANAFNRIEKAPLKELLLYNGMDSLFTYKLWEVQSHLLQPSERKACRFFNEASLSLSRAESRGLCIDEEGASVQQAEIGVKMKALLADILSQPEMEQWDRPAPFRPGAPDDISHLLYDKLGYTATRWTESGKVAGDKGALEEIDLPLVKKTLEWRKWERIRGTYITGFLREAVDGVIHPFFNLATADTFRSSSSEPNFQNIPKRDKETAKPLRKLLKPHPGQRLIEYDYKAVEVAIASCYNKDPNLLTYVRDPSTDMHRDMAIQIFLKDLKTFTKDERQLAKNKFVFPAFYGDYYGQMAPALWKDAPPETRSHLKKQGLRNLADFTEHVRLIEEDFWGNRFAVYSEWKQKQWHDYQRRGYVELYTGFRCYGRMDRKQVVNYPIQGTAFHCLLRTMTKVDAVLLEQKMRSEFMGQIHDAAVPSVDPDEEDEFDRLMWYWGTQEIREAWDWIIVPLSLEKSRSAVDGNWAETEECGLLDFSSEAV